MQRCKLKKVCGIPRILRVNLACVDKFEHNLALPGTTEPIQDKDVLHPKMMEKILSHCREDVLLSGKDIGWRGTDSSV